jgi:glycosyltransferase involved in cell wall biosynthesis
MNKPLVSVVVPVYNNADFISETINTIHEQDYQPIEILMVDDGSTDDSAILIQQFPDIRYIHQNNKGPGAAKNTGILASQGEYIAFLDADDLWKPNKISQQVAYFDQCPQLGYIITQMTLFMMPGIQKPSWLKPEFLQQALPAYLPSSLMVKRKTLMQVGLFDESLKTSDEVDWFFHAKDLAIPMAILPDVLVERRIHEHNLSNKINELHATLLESVKRSLLRKQLQPNCL